MASPRAEPSVAEQLAERIELSALRGWRARKIS
jgi:hypothetical protein